MTFTNARIGKRKLSIFLCRLRQSAVRVFSDKFNTLRDLCGNYSEPVIIATPSRNTVLKVSQANVEGPVQFNMKYKVHPCGGVFNDIDSLSKLNLPSNYTGSLDCVWAISAPDGQILKISVGKAVFGTESCTAEYLTIANGMNPYHPTSLRICRDRIPTETISQGRNIWVAYHADNFSANTNLNIEISSDVLGCGGVISRSSQTIKSPNFPQPYKENEECSWEIRTEHGFRVKLGFQERFYLEDSVNCSRDFIEISDYVNGDWKVLGRECGRQIRKSYNSTMNQLKILFRSDSSINGDGFQISWSQFCGGTFEVTKSPQRLISPGQPLYTHNLNCTYIFSASEETYINLNFTRFALEKGTDSQCQFDNLTLIYSEYFSPWGDPDDTSVYCGDRSPGFVRKRKPVYMKFMTDQGVTKTGFELFYSLDDCGGNITSGQLLTVTVKENKYLKNSNCVWNITAPQDKVIVLRFRSFIMEHSMTCDYDFIKVYEGKVLSEKKRLALLCGNLTLQLPVIKSKGNNMILHFRSDGSYELDGFSTDIIFARGESYGCGGNIRLKTNESINRNILKSQPSYEAFLDCHWDIETTPGRVIKLTFSSFDVSYCFNSDSVDNETRNIDNNTDCDCDYLEVRDGIGFKSLLIGKYCGTANPGDIISSTNFAKMIFKSDGTLSGRGINLSISSIPSPCGLSDLTVTKNKQILMSPDHNQGTVPRGIMCRWILRSPSGIHVRIVDLDLEHPSLDTGKCTVEKLFITNDNVEEEPTDIIARVFTESLNTAALGSAPLLFCGEQHSYDVYLPDSHLTLILTTSHGAKRHKGFKLEYSIPDCSRNYTEPQGKIVYLNEWDVSSCNYQIRAPENYTIALYVKELSIYSNCDESQFIQIRDGASPTSDVLKKMCGDYNFPLFSTGHQLTIEVRQVHSKFVANLYYVTTDKGRGCGGTLNEIEGSIFSPLYPNISRSNKVCDWTVQSPLSLDLKIIINVNRPSMTSLCDTNYLELLDRNNDILTKFCLDDPHYNYNVQGNHVRIRSHTTENNKASWFLLFSCNTE